MSVATTSPPRSSRWLRLSVVAGAGVGLALGWPLASLALSTPGAVGPVVLAIVPVALLACFWALTDHRYAVLLFAVALPAGLTTLPGGVQVVQLAALGVIALVAFRRVHQGQFPLTMSPPVVTLLALLVWSVALSPVADDLTRALRWNLTVSTAVLLVAAIATAAGSSLARLRHCAMLLFAGSVVTCAIALPESTQRRSFGAAVVDGRAQGVFNQPNELGLFAGTTVVLAVALLLSAPPSGARSFQRIALGLGGLVALGALALSLSRGAWMGAVLALGVAAVLVPAVRRGGLIFLGATGLLAVLLLSVSAAPESLVVVGSRAGVIADRGANPYDERPAIWAEGLQQVRDHPWTGVGAAGFTDTSARSESEVVASVRPAHAHNVVLNVTAEGGLPAGLALVVATTLIGAAVLRNRRDPRWSARDSAFIASIGCVPLVMVGQGLLDAPIRNPTTLLHTAAVVGLAVAAGYATTSLKDSRS